MLTPAPALQSSRTEAFGASARGDRDAAVRTTIFRTWLLVLLSKRPCHGYDLMEPLRSRSLVKTTGHLYRTLGRMEIEGLLSSQWMASSRSPHLRRVYELTPAGNEALTEQTRVVRDLADQLRDLCDELRAGDPSLA